MLDEVSEFFARLGEFAETVQRRLGWFLLIGLGITILLALRLYTPGAALWWNVVKCGMVFLPILIWGVVWSLLSQIREAPEMVSSMAEEHQFSFSHLRAQAAGRKPGLISLFTTLRELRNNEAFDVFTDAIGSVTLLANPFFMILSFIMLVALITLVLVAPIFLFL